MNTETHSERDRVTITVNGAEISTPVGDHTLTTINDRRVLVLGTGPNDGRWAEPFQAAASGLWYVYCHDSQDARYWARGAHTPHANQPGLTAQAALDLSAAFVSGAYTMRQARLGQPL